MARASIAYSAARRVGAGHVMEYSENIKQELMKIQGVLSNFMAGLMAGEFEVYYQPKEIGRASCRERVSSTV